LSGISKHQVKEKEIMFFRLVSACAGSLMLSACASSTQTATKPVGQANLASTFCQRMGGQTIVHESGRGAYGTCLMKDGSESEEWAFYRSWYPRMD
jgi:putative hemolysin